MSKVIFKIGDTVNYEIDADVPQYDVSVDEKSIKYEISDTMCQGLTFDKTSLVVNGIDAGNKQTTLTAGYTVETPTASTTFTIHFMYAQIKNYSKIQVLYNAKLNEKAAIGQKGNDNTGAITYTNNPTTGTDHHEEHKTYVYTFGINIMKMDAASTSTFLDGATFELLDSSDNTPLAVYTYDSSDSSKSVIPLDSTKPTVVTQKGGFAYFLGMKEGTYYIRELSAPAGYQLLTGDIAVTITAILGGDNQPSGDFSCTYQLPGGATTTANYTQTSTNPILKVLAKFNVPNTKGFTLPGTGGIGTTIFVVGGIAILLLGGCMAVLYFRKKRNSERQ